MVEALELLNRDHAERARQLWEKFSGLYPEQAVESDLSVQLLFKLRLDDTLQKLLQDGMKKLPHESRFYLSMAALHYEKGDFNLALEYAVKFQKRAPTDERGYRYAAAALSNLNKSDESEHMLAKAFQIVPKDPALLIEYAKIAERRSDWPEALTRWNRLYDVCNHLAGISGAAMTLARMKRFSEAEQLIESIRYQAGTEPEVWTVFARLAELQDHWPQAVERWSHYRRLFPMNPFGYLQSVRPLEMNKQVEKVPEILRDGVPFVKHHQKYVLEYARATQRFEMWAEAAELWATVRELLPENKDGYVVGAQALRSLGRIDEAGALERDVHKKPTR